MVDGESAKRRESSGDQVITPETAVAFQRLQELIGTPWESYGQTVSFDKATDLFEFLHYAPLTGANWAFRGHADECWALVPSLDRLSRKYKGFRDDAEEYVRLTFKRRAQHYLRDIPDELDELEWLALMRHHGAPTRLLDWTRSPYVAAFFATSEAKDGETSAIWAIDIDAIKSAAIEILSDAGLISRPAAPGFSFSDRDVFNRLILRETQPAVVVPVQPFKTNLRLTSQQGLFLCLNSPALGLFEIGLKQVLQSDRARFTQSVLQMQDNPDDLAAPDRLYKLRISPQARRGILKELHRMNINYATLYPGLDGFARSLGTNVTISEPFCLLGPEIDSQI